MPATAGTTALAQDPLPDGATPTTTTPAADPAADPSPPPAAGPSPAAASAPPAPPAPATPAAPSRPLRLFTPPVNGDLGFDQGPLSHVPRPGMPEPEPAPPPPPSERTLGRETAPGATVDDDASADGRGAGPDAAAGGALGPALPPSGSAAQIPDFFIGHFQIPPFLLSIYQAAGIQYGVPWEVLAAINEIE
ncbi:MAG TPA: hypothetical protein VL422_19145, partial [Miltoncostaea sp.]|nr:hypothetical protein [Miltoncostaea sp.]